LDLIPPDVQLSIMVGPLRGARWVVGSGNHVCWMGIYEYRKQLALKRLLRSGGIFYDIGAHVGFHTLLASRVLGLNGRVCAFEPFPRNLACLREHLRLNEAMNVQVIPAAVADRSGVETFAERGTYQGGLQPAGKLQVPTISVDLLVQAGSIPPPDYVKIDVEGGEHRALLGMRETLATHRPTVLLATHGAELHRDCIELLRLLGYDVQPLAAADVWRTDELIARHPSDPRAH
jgi:FkbM family methyltransferase